MLYYSKRGVQLALPWRREILQAQSQPQIIHKIASLDPSLLCHLSEYISSMISYSHHNVNVHSVPSPPRRTPNPNLAPRHQPLPHTPHPYLCLPDPEPRHAFSICQEQCLHFICQHPRCSARVSRVPLLISQAMGPFN